MRLRLRLGHASRGQGLVEYGLLLLLVALVAVGAVTLFGQKTSATYSRIECRVNQAQTQVACPSGGN